MCYFNTEGGQEITNAEIVTLLWKKFSLNNNVNAIGLGQMYRSMLSLLLRIGEQYLSLCFARPKVLSLNSSEWWKHWPIHPPQNYRIPSMSSKGKCLDTVSDIYLIWPFKDSLIIAIGSQSTIRDFTMY